MAEVSEDRRWVKIASITAPAIIIAGSLVGYLSNSGFGNNWYDPLREPALQPPGWVFGTVWPILYALMGITLAMIIASPPSRTRKLALILFALQLIANFSWSPVFFGAGMIDAAFLVILTMNVLVTATIIAFWQVRPLAGLLLLPYLAWLCLATTLNYQTGELNPGADRAPLGITGA